MNKKVKVYIDFEAISAPFSKVHKMDRVDMPFCYSIGVKDNKAIKVLTTILDFDKFNISEINIELKKHIIRDINRCLDTEDFEVNNKTTIFVGYSPLLEIKILNRLFKNIKVQDLANGVSFSLSKATDKYFKKIPKYFEDFRSIVEKNINGKFYSTRGLAHDGALAALAGYVLYERALGKSSRFSIDEEHLSTEALRNEIIEYSKDDVQRMEMISNNYAQYKEDAINHKESIRIKNKLRKTQNAMKVLLEYLESENKTSMNIDEIKDTIKDIGSKLLK